MEQKIFKAALDLVEDGQPGEFRAVFATLNVTDHDRDVTAPGAFEEQAVVVEPWNHGWTLPAGKGVIKADENEAWIEGVFFLDTEVGQANYQTVKNLGALAEWSYTFDIVQAEAVDPARNNGAERILQQMDVVGVSPVTRGAGINTRTVAIKSGKAEPSEKRDGEAGPDPEGTAAGNPSTIDLMARIDLLEMSIIMQTMEV